MDQATQDVTPVETETTPESSTENQTTETTQEQNASPAQEDSTKTDHIPYDRFKEKVEEVNQLKEAVAELQSRYAQPQYVEPQQVDPQKEVIKQQFKAIADELGYVSQDKLQQQKEDEALKQEISQLQKEFDGKDGRPKFSQSEIVNHALKKGIRDLRAAYQDKYQKQLIDWHVQQALSKTGGVKTEKSDGSGADGGTDKNSLLQEYRRGDRSAWKQYVTGLKFSQKMLQK